jgi:hypothetical protein
VDDLAGSIAYYGHALSFNHYLGSSSATRFSMLDKEESPVRRCRHFPLCPYCRLPPATRPVPPIFLRRTFFSLFFSSTVHLLLRSSFRFPRLPYFLIIVTALKPPVTVPDHRDPRRSANPHHSLTVNASYE